MDTLTTEILILKRQTAQNIIEIGRRLIEAKEMVGHGKWLAYLQQTVNFTDGTARRFMKAAEAANWTPVSDLDPSKVYLLLEAVTKGCHLNLHPCSEPRCRGQELALIRYALRA